LIRLSGKKAIEVGIDQVTLVCVKVYDSDKDVQLELITQQLEWAASTNCSIMQSKMGCGNIFLTTATKFIGKNIYRYKRECCKVPVLYRSHYLSIVRINKTLYRKRGTIF